MKTYLLLLSIFYFLGCSNSKLSDKVPNLEKPNVLFISVDDLRPELACYSHNYIKSPNLDKLALSGCVFTNHFSQVPTCGASRFSMLTGMLPRTSTHLNNEAIHKLISGKPESENPETFIHHLKRNGYYTVGIGKISHYPEGLLYGYTDPIGTDLELPLSWNEMLFDHGKWGTGWNAFFGYANGENRQSLNRKVKPYECAEVNDEGYPDGLTTKLAVKKLGELAKEGKPFFLGVGFFKPHLPFNSPKKYWDLYNESEIPLTPSPNIPENVNLASLHNSNEFNDYLMGNEKASLSKPLSDEYARKIRHAYFSCVSYIDAQIGEILKELGRLDLDENTIVVIWSDHGWQLGDHREWGKHTIFERALKNVLIIKTPEIGRKGMSINNITSSIDIYPTLMELCDIEMPYKTDGRSLVNLMKDPFQQNWEDVSFSYFRHGISLRTKRYRLTRYFRNEEPTIELYDHYNDPNENINIANTHPEIVEELMPLWEKGNTGIY